MKDSIDLVFLQKIEKKKKKGLYYFKLGLSYKSKN